MLSVAEPGKLVLTFQSIPPFVVESIFALTLAVLLASPLILQVQQFLLPSHGSLTAHRKKHGTVRSHPVVTHYPVSVFADSASSSNSDLHLESVRRTISTPLLQASNDIRNRGKSTTPENTLADNITKTTTPEANRKDIFFKNSSSFVATDSQLPIVDISAFDYDVYRYKLIEAALRRQYDDYQPPGDVVLNSINLNTNDSTVAVRLDDRYHHSFFDFVEEHYDATNEVGKKEYMHPLDHFLVKGPRIPETVEKETETGTADASREPVSQDWRSFKVASNDDGGTKKRQREGDLDYVTKRGSKSSNPRASGSAVPSSAKNSTCPRFAGKRGVTRLQRATSSTDSISMKRDTLSESPRQENRQDTFSSIDGVERESINCTTISSIDSESVRSESSKHPDDHSGRSRDSSIASTWTMSDRQAQPWLAGNQRAPYNRRNVDKLSPRTRETIEKDKTASKQPGRLIRNRSISRAEPSGHAQSRSRSLANRNASKQISLTGTIKESKANEPRKLEPIRSETDETNARSTFSTNDPSIRGFGNDRSDRPSDSIAKNATEPVAREPQSIAFFVDTVQERSESRVRPARPNGARKADNFGRPKSSPGQKQKSVKRSRDKDQRSKTIAPSPKTAELSSESLHAKEQFNGNAAVNSTGNDQEKKEWTNESGKMFKEAERNFQGDQPRRNARAKSNLCQVRHAFDPIRRNDDRNGNAVGKLSDDFDPKKLGPGTRQLAATTVKNRLPVGKRLTTVSRPPRQDGDSKIAAGLQDSVRSMPIGSSKSPSIGRKVLKTVQSEDNEGNRLSKNQNENFKLPSKDTNAAIAMQAGLKKYIKKLKRVLSDRDNPDIDELVSLSLTDAILPEIEATLSSIEVQQVQTVLSMAEKKSEMMQQELPVVRGNVT